MKLAESAIAALDTVTAGLPGGGEHRAGQRRMLTAVAEVVDDGGHLVVQAGTGTGKSLAYLLPTVLAGRRAVITTATKALQDQLAGKDLPLLSSTLEPPFDFAVLKGRGNYLCLQRLDELADPDQLDLEIDGGPVDPVALRDLSAFAAESDTGDRGDLRATVDDRTWRRVSVGRDECPGAVRCARGDDCFAEMARARAAAADLVIVNHHLYALHVATRELLPDHELVIIDEAHQLEDVVAAAAGRSLTPGRVAALARSASAVIADREPVEQLEQTASDLRELLEPLVGSRLPDGPSDELGRAVELVRSRADRVVQALRAVPDDAPVDTRARSLRARQAADSLLDDVETLRFPTPDDVIWIDGPASNPALRSTPVKVDELLAENLWDRRSAILTSATLPGSLVAAVGLPDSTVTLDVASPFDYAANTLLYCPTHLPDPRHDDDRTAGIAELESLMVAAGGRTLALFTSLAAMGHAARVLEARLPWTVLVQGERAKASLLDQFSSEEETSLFATMSFWQGVDVPGRACTLVVIDRLPFPRPDDPVLQARRDRAGRTAFRSIDLPRAATLLAQGVGRLIRADDDRGVVAVLDPRLATARSYRWDLIGSLPPMRRTRDPDEALAFLRELRDSA